MIDMRAELEAGGVKGLFEACGLQGPSVADAPRFGRDLRAAWEAQTHPAPMVMVAAKCGTPVVVLALAASAAVQSLVRELGEPLPGALRQALELAEQRTDFITMEQYADAVNGTRLWMSKQRLSWQRGLGSAVLLVLRLVALTRCACGRPESVHGPEAANVMVDAMSCVDIARAGHGIRTGRIPSEVNSQCLAVWTSELTAVELRKHLTFDLVVAYAMQPAAIPRAEYDWSTAGCRSRSSGGRHERTIEAGACPHCGAWRAGSRLTPTRRRVWCVTSVGRWWWRRETRKERGFPGRQMA